MGKSRLKRKVWVTACALTIMSIMIILHTPSIFLQVLPIMIPASLLTINLPTDIFTKEKKKTDLQEKKKSKLPITSEGVSIKKRETKKVEKSEDIIDNIMNDNHLTPENKKQMLQIFKSECQENLESPNDKQNTKKRNYVVM